MDRLLLTPPFLLVTLFALRAMAEGDVPGAVRASKAAYRNALITNWKVGVLMAGLDWGGVVDE